MCKITSLSQKKHLRSKSPDLFSIEERAETSLWFFLFQCVWCDFKYDVYQWCISPLAIVVPANRTNKLQHENISSWNPKPTRIGKYKTQALLWSVSINAGSLGTSGHINTSVIAHANITSLGVHVSLNHISFHLWFGLRSLPQTPSLRPMENF